MKTKYKESVRLLLIVIGISILVMLTRSFMEWKIVHWPTEYKVYPHQVNESLPDSTNTLNN